MRPAPSHNGSAGAPHGSVARCLATAQADSAARCSSVWPREGRVHPSDPTRMLGGQLKLQMESDDMSGSLVLAQTRITCLSAHPLGFEAPSKTSRGGVVTHEVVALGLADGTVQLLMRHPRQSAQGAI